jgi:hypothetical protein
MTIPNKETEKENDSEDLSLRNEPSIIIPNAVPIYSAAEPQPVEPTNNVAEHEALSNEITSVHSQPLGTREGVIFETPVSYDVMTVFCVIILPILALVVIILITGYFSRFLVVVIILLVFVDLFLPHRLAVLAEGTIEVTTFGNCKFSYSDISNAYLASDHVGSLVCDGQYIGWDTKRIGRVVVKRGAGKRHIIISPQDSRSFIYVVNQVATSPEPV